MFYSTQILARRGGPLGLVWMAAHMHHQLKRSQVAGMHLTVAVEALLHPEAPLALRLSGQLLLGLVRLYSKQLGYLHQDCQEALVRIRLTFNMGGPGAMDGPHMLPGPSSAQATLAEGDGQWTAVVDMMESKLLKAANGAPGLLLAEARLDPILPGAINMEDMLPLSALQLGPAAALLRRQSQSFSDVFHHRDQGTSRGRNKRGVAALEDLNEAEQDVLAVRDQNRMQSRSTGKQKAVQLGAATPGLSRLASRTESLFAAVATSMATSHMRSRGGSPQHGRLLSQKLAASQGALSQQEDEVFEPDAELPFDIDGVELEVLRDAPGSSMMRRARARNLLDSLAGDPDEPDDPAHQHMLLAGPSKPAGLLLNSPSTAGPHLASGRLGSIQESDSVRHSSRHGSHMGPLRRMPALGGRAQAEATDAAADGELLDMELDIGDTLAGPAMPLVDLGALLDEHGSEGDVQQQGTSGGLPGGQYSGNSLQARLQPVSEQPDGAAAQAAAGTPGYGADIAGASLQADASPDAARRGNSEADGAVPAATGGRRSTRSQARLAGTAAKDAQVEATDMALDTDAQGVVHVQRGQSVQQQLQQVRATLNPHLPPLPPNQVVARQRAGGARGGRVALKRQGVLQLPRKALPIDVPGPGRRAQDPTQMSAAQCKAQLADTSDLYLERGLAAQRRAKRARIQLPGATHPVDVPLLPLSLAAGSTMQPPAWGAPLQQLLLAATAVPQAAAAASPAAAAADTTGSVGSLPTLRRAKRLQVDVTHSGSAGGNDAGMEVQQVVGLQQLPGVAGAGVLSPVVPGSTGFGSLGDARGQTPYTQGSSGVGAGFTGADTDIQTDQVQQQGRGVEGGVGNIVMGGAAVAEAGVLQDLTQNQAAAAQLMTAADVSAGQVPQLMDVMEGADQENAPPAAAAGRVTRASKQAAKHTAANTVPPQPQQVYDFPAHPSQAAPSPLLSGDSQQQELQGQDQVQPMDDADVAMNPVSPHLSRQPSHFPVPSPRAQQGTPGPSHGTPHQPAEPDSAHQGLGLASQQRGPAVLGERTGLGGQGRPSLAVGTTPSSRFLFSSQGQGGEPYSAFPPSTGLGTSSGSEAAALVSSGVLTQHTQKTLQAITRLAASQLPPDVHSQLLTQGPSWLQGSGSMGAQADCSSPAASQALPSQPQAAGSSQGCSQQLLTELQAVSCVTMSQLVGGGSDQTATQALPGARLKAARCFFDVLVLQSRGLLYLSQQPADTMQHAVGGAHQELHIALTQKGVVASLGSQGLV